MGNIKFRSQQGTGEDTSQEQKYAMNDNEPNIVLGEDPNVINNGISKDPLQENSNEPTILDEDISKREENVKYYNMSDGTCRAMYFDEPVHYFNESEGRFRGIDNTLELNQQNGADDFEGYETKYGNIKVKFARNLKNRNLMAVKKGEFKLMWQILGKGLENNDEENAYGSVMSSEACIVPQSRRNSDKISEVFERLRGEIKYDDFIPSANLHYTVSSSKIKEDIIIKERMESYLIGFKLKTENLEIQLSQDQKNLEFFSTKIDNSGNPKQEVIFSLPSAYMIDAKNERCNNVFYEIVPLSKDEYLFKVIPDAEWINSAEREFPVTIDPTIITDFGAANAGTLIRHKHQANYAKRAGTGFLDLFTQNLNFVHEDVTISGEKTSLNILHIFNQKYASKISSTDYSSLPSEKTGCGWKTNFHRYIVCIETENGNNYIYIDQIGNEHVLFPAQKDGINVIISADGSLQYDVDTCTLSDKSGNKLVFNSNGQLAQIKDVYNTSIDVSYNSNNTIKSITDGNGRTAQFSYYTSGNETGHLSNIIYNNRYTSFGYDSSNRLITITYPDNNSSNYKYDTAYRLLSARDMSGYKLNYLYETNKVTVSESTVTEKIFDNSVTLFPSECSEKIGEKVIINFSSNKDKAILTSNNGRRTVHLFDEKGKSDTSFLESSSGSGNIVQAEKIQFSADRKNADGENVMFSAVIDNASTNYIKNGSFIGSALYVECWQNVGCNSSDGDGVDRNIFMDGGYSFKIKGLPNTTKYIYQTVRDIPDNIESFILYGYAKGDLRQTQTSRFRLCARMKYTDSTPIKEFTADFNPEEKNWQLAATGFTKNPYKTINYIEIWAEYSDNINQAYFDEIRLIEGKYSKQAVKINEDESKIVKIDDASSRELCHEINSDGLMVKSTMSTPGASTYTADYTYDRRKVKTQSDSQNYETINTYNSYGGVTKSQTSRSNETPFVEEYNYYNDGITFKTTAYDPRGYDFESVMSYAHQAGTLQSVKLPDGQEITYEYNNDNSIKKLKSNGAYIEYYYTRVLLTRLIDNNNVYNFEYDGFGTLIRTLVNGNEYTRHNYYNLSTYSSTDESTFNYTQTEYSNEYAEKAVFDKDGRTVCVKGIKNGTEQEILRTAYDAKGRINTVTDNISENTQSYYYISVPYTQGKTMGVTIRGSRAGNIEQYQEGPTKPIRKTVTFGQQKNYIYYFNNYPNTRPQSINLPSAGKVSYGYDVLGRLKKRTATICPWCVYVSETYGYLSGKDPNTSCVDRSTDYISKVIYNANDVTGETLYGYDKRGNIKTISETGKNCSYTYDEFGRLKREDNQALNFTKTYTYDGNGNITSITEYDYTTAAIPLADTIRFLINYIYTSVGDRLLRIIKQNPMTNEETVILQLSENDYDSIGNTCKWRENVLQWEYGRSLSKYGGNSYYYNASGIRQEKVTASGVTHKYYLEGDTIHKETRGNDILWYYYEAGGVTALEYNGNRYYFQKNIQGDILRIYNESADLVASYVYDAWGNHKIYNGSGTDITHTNPSHIGNINPFRYRGYYYDAETGLYFLGSRYYDPEVGRFINADDISYLDPTELNGLNLYAYCGNDPVNRWDPTGHSWESFWKGLGSGLMIAGGIALCFVPGAQLIGAGLIIAGAGGLIGGAIGAATGYGFSAGWDIGTLIGGAIGLAVAAPQLWSLAANLTLPTLGWMSTTAGSLVFGITGTVAVAVPVGAIATTAAAAGLVYMAYQRKPAAPRISSGSKKEAYDKAFYKGGKKPPTLHPNGKYGPHFHPAGKFKAWHYYFGLMFGFFGDLWNWLFGENG